MSTVSRPTTNVAKPSRRKTSHLKLVPETRELREQLRAKCAEVAAKLDKSVPLTKDQMEQVARATLESIGFHEGYVGWAMVMLSSEFFREQVAATDPKRRLFLLPHCLKHAEGCPADYDEFGMNCKQCGACSIADFRTIAEEMGYKVLVAEGSPVVLKIIVSGYVDAIVGVACLNVLEKAIDKILLAGIPCMAVPLLSSDCRNTSVDEDWVSEMVSLQQTQPQAPLAQEASTRSYIHLMRAASDMFQSQRLLDLVAAQRGPERLDLNSTTPLQGIDPISATEKLAIDFVSKGGKYSRPFITLAAYDALTGDRGTTLAGADHLRSLPDSIYRAAMSIEMFHKASLVHDDIEDDDFYRYGHQTMHRQFGTSTAINVGDYMIGLGYRLVSRDHRALGPDCAADILDSLAAAHMRLSEGQGAELIWRDCADKRLTPLDALKIYALKTAPAFEVALYTGIRLATDATPYLETIRVFARNLGVAFQILNDLNDWQGDSTNKMAAAGDVLGGRPTLLLALALQALPPQDQAKLLEITSEACNLSQSERLSIAQTLLQQANVFEQASRLVDKHHERACEVMEKVEPAPLRRLLQYLLDTVLERQQPTPLTMVSINNFAKLPVVSPS